MKEEKKMKNIYLAQPTNMLSGTVYLPYTVGAIAAYSWQFPEIKENYNLKEFLFLKTPFEEVIANMENPFLVGFSSYLWNIEYNLQLAAKIKENWPECIILFGGPQIPDDVEYLKKYVFIDILVHAEGEVPFYKLLLTLMNDRNLSEVPSISYRKNEEYLRTEKEIPCDLSDFPSPYTMGLFDYIISDPQFEGIQLDVVMETNRGCPYKCIYCCWGGNDAPLRQFPMEKVKSELDWFAENKIFYCVCADGNFGILNRDEEIVDYLIELKATKGYPQKFATTAAKNKDDFIFKINKKMHDAGLNKGVSVSCQSLSPEVLENIGRKNMPIEYFSEQLDKYRKAGIETYTDLILGLPGETFESFCRGVFGVIEAGQHDSINISRCELLPNTRMYDKKVLEKFKIKTVVSSLCQNHSKVLTDSTLGSRSEIVVETSTMTQNEWKEACSVSFWAQGLHLMGVLRFVSVYLRKAKNISYYDFYMDLYKKIKKSDGTVKKILDHVVCGVDTFLRGEGNLGFTDARFGDIFWPYEEGLFLCIVYELDAFFDEIAKYIEHYFDDKELFEDLLKYQKNIICAFGDQKKELEFKYDWLEYFSDIISMGNPMPKRKNNRLSFEPSYQNDWFEYAKYVVWYGKRDNRSITKPTLIE